MIVGLALGQRGGQIRRDRLRLEIQAAQCLAMARAIEFEAVFHVRALHGSKLIERAGDLARIAGHFSHALFVAIQLFEHDHG